MKITITYNTDMHDYDYYTDGVLDIHCFDYEFGACITLDLSQYAAERMLSRTSLNDILAADCLVDVLTKFTVAAQVADMPDEATIVAEGEQTAREAEAHANQSRPTGGHVRPYADDFKADVVARYLSGEKVVALCDSTGITRMTLYRWLREAGVQLRSGNHPLTGTTIFGASGIRIGR